MLVVLFSDENYALRGLNGSFSAVAAGPLEAPDDTLPTSTPGHGNSNSSGNDTSGGGWTALAARASWGPRTGFVLVPLANDSLWLWGGTGAGWPCRWVALVTPLTLYACARACVCV
jgi:hypothetical protein